MMRRKLYIAGAKRFAFVKHSSAHWRAFFARAAFFIALPID
jgi:hypothetical protein